MIKNMPITVTANSGNWQYQTVDYIASLMWTAAPWSWTLGQTTNVSIVAGTTDYTVTPPSDFLYLTRAYIADGNQINELKIVSSLPATGTQVGVPTQVFYDVPNTKVRVFPVPTTNYSGTLVMIYKKQPPKITNSNFSTAGAQIFPDCYFPVLQEGVLWMAYQYADDQRAGNATVNEEGKTQFTQQLGIFQAAIAEMRRSEKLPLNFPESPISHG
jgi:hypothetical protein